MSNSLQTSLNTYPRKRPRAQRSSTLNTSTASLTPCSSYPDITQSVADNYTQVELGSPEVATASTEALEVSGSGDDVEEYSDHEVAAFVKKFFTDAELHIFMPFVEEPRTPSDKHFRKFEEGVDSLRHLLSQKFKGDEELAQFALEMLFMYYLQESY